MTGHRADPVAPGPVRGSLDEASQDRYDLAIIGGGVYGITMLLEAARRGKKAILLERDDFGAGVSWSSHRIIHGGLRYLQSLDLARFKESVRERKWFLETFPQHIDPLSCLVPLRGEGMQRPVCFATAALLNNAMAKAVGGKTDRLAPARLLSTSEFGSLTPGVPSDGVRGAGQWQDGLMLSSERVLMCMLRLACDMGGRAVAHTPVTGIRSEGGAITGVECGGTFVRADAVVNCAGPSSADLASHFGGQPQPLFSPMLAFNALFDTEPPFKSAVALKSRVAGGRMLFVVPWSTGIAVGTWEEPVTSGSTVPESSIETLIEAANEVLPGVGFSREQVAAVWSGLLPRAADGRLTPSDRPVVVHHASTGGLRNAWSVSGVKFTTARLIADRTVRALWDGAREPATVPSLSDPVLRPDRFAVPPDDNEIEGIVGTMIREESARTIDDVCRRRSMWYASPDRLRAVSSAIGRAFGIGPEAAGDAVEESLASAAQRQIPASSR